MRYMTTAEIREKYLNYFQEKGCKLVPSSSLIPDDPSLLLTSAGMVQFKPYFLQQKQLEAPYIGTTSVQKCVRTNDIDIIGTTGRHLSFFEMLGNFSFGEYFKEEMCAWAYDFSVNVLGLPPERLYFTVFEDDDETIEIWKNLGVPEDHISRLGEDDNFWRAGPTGPCGPCSEIYYDQGPEFGCGSPDCAPGCDCDRFLEYWNCVFTQYDGQEDGTLAPLPKKNIDTGMGLERMAAIMQGVQSNYETDVLRSLVAVGERLAGVTYGEDAETDLALRIIADHSRSVTFMIADGILPGNEGRGYVLRRLLRRAIMKAQLIGIEGHFLNEYVDEIVRLMGDVYPEIVENRELERGLIMAEEDRFGATLRQGQAYLEEALGKLEGDVLSGEEAFTLHDTYGFPIELTLEMAAEQGVKVDEAKFRELMAEQKSRARADALKKRHNVDLSVYDDFKKTLVSPIDFLGYTDMSARAKVIGIMQEGKGSVPAVTGPANVEVILDRTPFYAEAGGQLADQGEILSDDGAVLEVDDVQKPIKDLIVHQCRLTEGTLVVGAEVNANIDLARRGAIARSHTATHMVHKALREELGPQATQRGSEDAPNRLRFDFQWSKAPAKSVISAVEERVNDKLRDNLAVTTKEMKFDDAIALGAMHLFGEKYGDIVRVVSIGEDGWSRELCGGTHVDHVGKIGMVNILSEASIGSGVRRVDAVVGQGAYDFNAREHALVSQLSDKLNARPDELAERVNALLAKLKESDRRLASMYESQLAASVPALVADTKNSAAPVKVAVKNVGHFGAVDALRKTVLDVRAQLGEDAPVVVALAGVNEDDKPMVAVATNEAARKAGIKAGDLVRGAAKVLGGGGGGKPDFAQGGGVDASKIDEALEALKHEAQKA